MSRAARRRRAPARRARSRAGSASARARAAAPAGAPIPTRRHCAGPCANGGTLRRVTDFYLLDEKLTRRGARRSATGCASSARRRSRRSSTATGSGPSSRSSWCPKIAALQLAGGTIEGYGCPGMSATAAGLVSMEWARADGSIGTFFGVHSNLAMQSIAHARLRGAEGALAAGDGRPGRDRRVRADRARPRLGRGRARDQRAPRRRRVRARRRASAGSATPRSPTS